MNRIFLTADQAKARVRSYIERSEKDPNVEQYPLYFDSAYEIVGGMLDTHPPIRIEVPSPMVEGNFVDVLAHALSLPEFYAFGYPCGCDDVSDSRHGYIRWIGAKKIGEAVALEDIPPHELIPSGFPHLLT